MRFLKFLAIVAALGFSYHYAKQRGFELPDLPPSPGSRGRGGFVPLPPAANQNFNTVYVIAPMNCSSDGAQRAKALTADLKARGIPAVMTSQVQFNPYAIDPNQAGQINDVMEGPIPIVFIRGKAKSNPSLREVTAEFKGRGGK